MTSRLTDKTGVSVTISLNNARPISSYNVHLEDGTLAGRADFIDAPDANPGRIFFHTEVAQEFSGRGLAGLLVREALAESVRNNVIVVPLCPLFANHLKEHGAEFQADGGRVRQPTQADVDFVRRAMASDR